jgi:hypothetical protein
VILRVPVLYGEVKNLEESAVTVLFATVLDGSKPAKVSDYEIRCPAHTHDIARILEGLSTRLVNHGHVRALSFFVFPIFLPSFFLPLAYFAGLVTAKLCPTQAPLEHIPSSF